MRGGGAARGTARSRGSPRVAFDAGPLLDPPTGVGRYARELARTLEALGVDLRRYAVAWRGARDDSIARWRVPARVAQAVWRRAGRPSIERLTGPVDVVHGTNFTLPALGGAAGVVTVHDLSFLRDDTFPGGRRLRALVPDAIRRARRVVVPTEAIAAEVAGLYALARDRLVVAREGVSPVFYGAAPLADGALARLGVARPFALAVGTVEPRKNLARLLQAWGRVAGSELGGWTLALAGPAGWGPALPPTPGVVPVGWVGDETLPGLLAAAEVFCYPSLYEGFGLPPLEAMAAGTPALVGRYSAAEEVVGDAALLVSPTDVDEIGDGLVRLVRDEASRRRLMRAGRARAAGFTWERTAVATRGAYEEAMQS